MGKKTLYCRQQIKLHQMILVSGSVELSKDDFLIMLTNSQLDANLSLILGNNTSPKSIKKMKLDKRLKTLEIWTYSSESLTFQFKKIYEQLSNIATTLNQQPLLTVKSQCYALRIHIPRYNISLQQLLLVRTMWCFW